MELQILDVYKRQNITGEDIEFDPTQLGLGDEGTNLSLIHIF